MGETPDLGDSCATADCERSRYAKGFCKPCYQRDYRTRNVERLRDQGRAYYQANRDKWAERHRDPARVEYMREYRETHRERLAEQQRQWLADNPDNERTRRLRTFGITPADYDRMETAQDGVCAICARPEIIADGRRLAVDHSHETGEVRGLLCARCNLHLGWLEQNPDLAAAMLAYLGNHEEVSDAA